MGSAEQASGMRAAADYDFLILGGGCAGLSMARALADRQPERRIALIEPRTRFPRDRTWCYWDVASHPFEAAASHAWRRWKLRFGGREWVHGPGRYRYCEIPADAFYRSALERLDANPSVDLYLGCKALGIEEVEGQAVVQSDLGPLTAERAFDSRPPPPPAAPRLLQNFVGLHVETERAAFDPGAVTLMDFDVSQRAGIHFFYVLPHSPTRALVEATFLSAAPLPEAAYLQAIDGYLDARHGVRRYDVVDRERGVIPLDPARPAPEASPHVTRIGTAGGLVKPSTGYAFLAIQGWTAAFADALALDPAAPPPPPRPRVSRVLDAIFLSFLRRHPERAPGLFAGLFERVRTDALVRFLTDTASPADRASVIRAMPKASFLREAWISRREWLRA